jgi:hypothetical protein
MPYAATERGRECARKRSAAYRIAHPEYWRATPERQAIRREKRNAFLATVKSKPCMDCGGIFPAECMDFDHVRGIKLLNVSQMILCKEEIVREEIAKCDLVCANCHRIRTVKRERDRIRTVKRERDRIRTVKRERDRITGEVCAA